MIAARVSFIGKKIVIQSNQGGDSISLLPEDNVF